MFGTWEYDVLDSAAGGGSFDAVVFIIADYPSISLAGLPEIVEVRRQSDRRRADFLGRAVLRGLLAHRGSIVLIFLKNQKNCTPGRELCRTACGRTRRRQ